MKVDTQLTTSDPDAIPGDVRRLENRGYDGLWTSETAHDPFLSLAAASYHTQKVTLGTAVSIAFARNPMTVAYTANDLQRYCRGRFCLGLGSQVRGHIQRRFSMPWSEPARRMREFIEAVRQIWRSWEEGVWLDFEGEFYRHTLMTPFFTPEVHPFGRPSILLAAVGPAMTRAAGEAADGVLLHSFSSADYVRAHVLPVLDEKLAKRGRERKSFEIAARAFVASGRNDEQLSTAVASIRQQIAFYASTPAYRPILSFLGLEALGDELHRMSRTDDERRWQNMAQLVPDALFDALAVTGAPAEVADTLIARYGDYADRLRLYVPYPHGRVVEEAVVDRLQGTA